MGSKLSTAQKGVCYHIVGILVSANVKFSKGKLKQFIRWLFLHFPQTSPEEVHNIQFWDKVGHEFPVNSLGHWSNQRSLKKQFDEFGNGTGGKLQALPGGQQQPKKLKGEHQPARRADTKRAGQGNKGTKTNQARGNVTISVSEADASKTTSAGPRLKVKQNNLCYDLGEPMLTTSSVSEPYRLQLTESLHLKDTDWHLVSVNPEQKGTWHRIRCKYIVIGDTKHTPHEIEIAPGMTTPDPEQFILRLHCFHPPLFLPKGQIVAQAIPVPFLPEGTEKQGPTVAQVQVIGKDKPNLWCNVNGGGESKCIEMLVDTGADCTVIPAQDWPAHWPLQNVAGHVQGVGGLQLARQPKSIIQIEGPSGQLANICPFVLDYWEPLLGRDLMAQWSVTINIPDSPQHFCTAVIEQQRPTQKLKWKTDKPVEVKQWPLSKQKIKALEEIVEDQLKKGHIVETTCQNAKLCPVSKSTSKLN